MHDPASRSSIALRSAAYALRASPVRLLLLLLLIFAWAALLPSVAVAAPGAASAWSETEHGRVRLIAGVEAVGTAPTLPLGLQFEMVPGWKIYWRTPGDAGFPPRIDWSGSANLAAATVLWPAPQRFSVLDFETIGYEDAVILPIEAQLARSGEQLSLTASVDYLTCKDICVPYRAQLALVLPAGTAVASRFSGEIAQFAKQVPPSQATTTSAADAGGRLAIEAAALAENEATLAIVARAVTPFVAPDVFIEGPAELAFGAPRVELLGDGRIATLRVPVLGTPAAVAALSGSQIVLTLVDGARAVEHTMIVGAGTVGTGIVGRDASSVGATDAATATTVGATTSPPVRSFAVILLLALVGGLILNLMPCVLPVLSIKLLAVVSHGGGDRRQVRLGFLATAAGILFSFLLLAVALIAIRAAGVAAGWGLQFQQPWFLVAMTLVVALFACNLWGAFELGVPTTVAAVDDRAARVHGLGGHFLTGALATLLATPCSAPFVGTAIGFALSGGPVATLAVFSALAVGLALPYLAVAAVPSMATRLPRPGRWMVWLRRGLGIVLVGTGVWLLTILAAAQGPGYAVRVGVLVAAMALALVLGRMLLPARWQRLSQFAALAFGVIAFLVPAPSLPTADALVDRGWQPFVPADIPSLVAAGNTVYVNVTADWCLTCKLNERLVLGRDPVASRLAETGVVAMRGNWTRPDEGIARYLAGFGRYGIPFDAVYGPANPLGTALPELLTAEVVMAALARAGGLPEARADADTGAALAAQELTRP